LTALYNAISRIQTHETFNYSAGLKYQVAARRQDVYFCRKADITIALTNVVCFYKADMSSSNFLRPQIDRYTHFASPKSLL
jgi:hypothetical protein